MDPRGSIAAVAISATSVGLVSGLASSCIHMECLAATLVLALATTVASAATQCIARDEHSKLARRLRIAGVSITCLILPSWYIAMSLAVDRTSVAG